MRPIYGEIGLKSRTIRCFERLTACKTVPGISTLNNSRTAFMHLTRFTDYALRVLIYLGTYQERRCSVSEIAETFNISQNHLMKVVQQLAQDGFLETTRGRGGGIQLGLSPEQIIVGDVIRTTEDDLKLAECETCLIAPACLLTGIFSEGTEAMLNVFDKYTLADLLKKRKPLAKRLGT